jgi:hypothetical protein
MDYPPRAPAERYRFLSLAGPLAVGASEVSPILSLVIAASKPGSAQSRAA